VEFYKYNKESIDVFNDEKTLSNSFKILIENLWPNNFDPNKNKNCYAPYNFKDKISKMNSLFEGISACDAKDLVNFIILTLQLELNKPDNDDDNVSGIKGQTNKKLLFVNFLRDYENNNKSIISDLFYAINYNQTKCSNCNTVLYNFQTYFFITFPLEEVRKYNSSKNQSNMNIVNSNSANIPTIQMQNQISINSMNMPMQNQISINSMNMPTQNQFNINSMNMPTQNQFNVSYMNMPTQNQMNMNMNMYNMSNQNNIMNNNILYMNMPQIQAPYNCNPQYNPNYNNQPFNVINNQQNIDTNEVSIIDCFEYDKRDNEMSGDNAMYCGKCKAKCNSIMNTNLETGPEVLILLLNRGKGIEFDVKIKFEENLDLENYIENKKYSRKYKLIGVITHIGDNSQDGHFISYCREPIENGEWTKYNDAFVSKVEDFKKEVIDFAMPYVLFYQRENKK
jgi:ubiquitin C-terminal hydrolase